jgi:protein-disulfide isomerase
LGASGTPLFVVGNQVINSAIGYDALKAAVAKARAAKG